MGLLEGIREAAIELGGFVSLKGSELQRTRLEAALGVALLTDEHDLDQYAAVGIGRHLWKTNKQLALSYLNALMTHAQSVHEAERLRVRSTLAASRNSRAYERAIAHAATEAQRIVSQRIPIADDTLRRDYKARPWCFALPQLLEILKQQPNSSEASAFFTDLIRQLCESWDHEETLRRARRDDDHFDYATERRMFGALTTFALGLSADEAVQLISPFAQIAQKHPAKVAALAKDLAYAEDRLGTIDTFWSMWTVLGNSLADAFDSLTRDRREVAQVLFLNLDWKETTKDWAPLRGREQWFTLTYRRLAPNSAISEAFVSFLHKVGSMLVPDALVLLAEKIHRTPLSSDALYRLELILAELVYAGEPRTRRETDLREATLRILDAMVDAGSSMAYRLRDDFVTPLQNDVLPTH